VTVRLALTGLVTSQFLVAALAVSPSAASSPARPAGRWQDATMVDYRRHLVALEDLTRACAKARDLKACDPTLVGLDDRVPVGAASSDDLRLIRYGWLRILFSRAEEPDKAQKAPDSGALSAGARKSLREIPPTTSQLLVDAQARLANDLAQANRTITPLPSHVEERNTMQQVLAGREFSNLQTATESDTALERFGNWLNRLFAKFEKLRTRSAWVGRALVWGFFGAVAAGLAWGLLQTERRWRIRLVPARAGLVPEAVSARDWQLWLADARKAAADGHWREAIHFLYWAAVARLESKRLWPTDRARTPREYLALMAADDPRQSGLASLTSSFERTWYGGREASESDYRRAEALAASLISASGAMTGSEAATGGGER
jgi:Domain of unknown function (DUF4129)